MDTTLILYRFGQRGAYNRGGRQNEGERQNEIIRYMKEWMQNHDLLRREGSSRSTEGLC
jgi:hypothetical protein